MLSSTSGPVRAGDSVTGGAFRFLNGEFLIKVRGGDTRGNMAVFDTIRTERGGPPLHVHEVEDEWFHVVDGVFDVSVGGRDHRLMPGDAILGPVGHAHAFTNVTETGRLLIVFSPAGRMEEFFRDAAALGPITAERFAQVSALYGMTVTGPPLALRSA